MESRIPQGTHRHQRLLNTPPNYDIDVDDYTATVIDFAEKLLANKLILDVINN